MGDGAAQGRVLLVYVIFSAKLGNLERTHQTRKPKHEKTPNRDWGHLTRKG